MIGRDRRDRSSAVATGAEWRRPVTVSDDGVLDRLDDFSGFVSSPDGDRVDLVTLRDQKGIVAYAMRRRGRLGRGSFLPRSKDAGYPWESAQAEQDPDEGQYPNAAVERSRTPRRRLADVGERCRSQGSAPARSTWMSARSVGASARSTLADTSDQILGVQVTPQGQVRVLWEVGAGTADPG